MREARAWNVELAVGALLGVLEDGGLLARQAERRGAREALWDLEAEHSLRRGGRVGVRLRERAARGARAVCGRLAAVVRLGVLVDALRLDAGALVGDLVEDLAVRGTPAQRLPVLLLVRRRGRRRHRLVRERQSVRQLREAHADAREPERVLQTRRGDDADTGGRREVRLLRLQQDGGRLPARHLHDLHRVARRLGELRGHQERLRVERRVAIEH